MDAQPSCSPAARAPGSVRLAVETLYVSSDLSLAQLLEQEPLKGTGIHLRTVESWCRKDKWVEKRRAFKDQLRRRTLEELGAQAVQARLQQIDELCELNRRLLAMAKKLRPRSLESLASAMCRVVQTTTKLGDSLSSASSTAPSAAPAPLPVPTKEDDLRFLAAIQQAYDSMG